MEGEFRVLNADYANRGAVADEALEVIRACWADTQPDVQTERFAVRGVAYSPLPRQRPGRRSGSGASAGRRCGAPYARTAGTA